MNLYIIDDDQQVAQLLATVAEPLFNQVHIFHHAKEFLQRSLTEQDVILLDLMMPDIDGIEVIRKLSERDCKAKLVLISGYDQGVLHSATGLAQDYGLHFVQDFCKPIAINELVNCLVKLSGNDQLTAIKTKSSHQVAQPLVPETNNHATKPSEYTEQQLQQAIEQNQLVLHFQPKVSLDSNQLIGVEALVRWQHPEHGLIYPDKFIPLAEQTGLIKLLTEQVINLAVEQSNIWQQKGLLIKISVNISAKNITDLTVPEQLRSLVRANDIDPAMIILEVTETELMDQLTTSIDILTRLRLKGFQLSIDDFGTGYSSLVQLHRVPFTELKIDRAFVKDLITNPESLAIVEICIMLGHKLHMNVVAEGVEDKATAEQLTQLGCDLVQGYYTGKPVPANMIEQDPRLIGVEKNTFSHSKTSYLATS